MRRFLSTALPLAFCFGCAAEVGGAPGASDLAATAPSDTPTQGAPTQNPPAQNPPTQHAGGEGGGPVAADPGITVQTVRTKLGSRACLERPPMAEGVELVEQPVPDLLCPAGTTFYAAERFEEVTVPAPDYLTDHNLGMPVRGDFTYYRSSEAGSALRVFRNTGDYVAVENRTKTYAGAKEITSSREYGAAVNAYFASFNFSAESHSNIALYRAVVEKKYHFVQDAQACFVAPNELPDDAVWYLQGITRGHAFYAILQGNKDTFGFGVGARFSFFSASLSRMRDSERLSLSIRSQGLQIKDNNFYTVVQADTLDGLLNGFEYSTDPNTGQPMPVAISATYRTLPYRCVPNDTLIPWKSSVRAKVRFDSIRVEENGAGCFLFFCSPPPDWLLEVSCKVEGEDQFINEDARIQALSSVRDRSNHTLATPDLGELPVVVGQELECGLSGTASSGKPVGFGSFRLRVPDITANQSQTVSFGAGSGRTTEYSVQATVEWILPEP